MLASRAVTSEDGCLTIPTFKLRAIGPPHCVECLVMSVAYSCSLSIFIILLPSKFILFLSCLVQCSSQFVVDLCPCSE